MAGAAKQGLGFFASVAVACRQFLSWWRAALAATSPAIFGETRFGSARPASASQSDSGLHLDIGSDTPPGSTLIVNVDPAMALVNRRRYPFDVIGSLPDLLKAETDRLTPFTAKEACLSFEISAYDWSRREVEVTFAVARRSLLRELRDELEAAGHRLLGFRVPAADGDLHISAVKIDEFGVGGRTIRPGRIILTAAALALLVAVVITPALRMRDVAEEQVMRVAALKAEAERIATLLEDVSFIEENLGLLERRRDAAVSKLALLNELSRIIPPDSWLLSVEIRDERIRLTGVSPAPAAVVTALATSPLLSEIQYRSAGVRNESLDGERFELSAQLLFNAEERS